jgi:phosphatidylserine/phosphatidylglycerophosphate/cardiolipin synthase-like enzyme
MKIKRLWLPLVALLIIGGVFAGSDMLGSLEAMFGTNSGSPKPTLIKAVGSIEVAFSPNNGVTPTVINALSQAHNTILVSAYSFTSKDIAGALLDAKKRGVAVKIILDKSQVSQKYSSSTFFSNQGFDLRIDVKHAIYHDKVMIIDEKTVITGSFNFTKAAETKNAENLLVLRDNPELAKLYMQDWWYNWQQAVPVSEFKAQYKTKAKGNDE